MGRCQALSPQAMRHGKGSEEPLEIGGELLQAVSTEFRARLNARLQDERGDRWDSEQTNQLARGGSLVPEWHEMLNYSSTDYCYLVAFLHFS